MLQEFRRKNTEHANCIARNWTLDLFAVAQQCLPLHWPQQIEFLRFLGEWRYCYNTILVQLMSYFTSWLQHFQEPQSFLSLYQWHWSLISMILVWEVSPSFSLICRWFTANNGTPHIHLSIRMNNGGFCRSFCPSTFRGQTFPWVSQYYLPTFSS